MLFEIVTAFIIAGTLILFVWLLRGMLLMPLTKGKHTKMTVVVKVQGREPCLEQTISGLNWLSSNGTLPANVVIVDDGMDEETRTVAEHLSRSQKGVCFQRKDVTLWQRNEEQPNYREELTP